MNRIYLKFQVLIFLIISILSYILTNFYGEILHPNNLPIYPHPSLDNYNSNYSFIEILQDSIILSSLIITFYLQKKFCKIYKNISVKIRTGIILLIFYEEYSHLTTSTLFTQFNYQSELNLHNSYFINEYAITNLPIFGGISWITLITFIFFISISISSYLTFLNRWITFRRKYTLLLLLTPFNIAATTLMRHFNLETNLSIPFMDNELMELYFYCLILIDTIEHYFICQKIKNEIKFKQIQRK